VQTWWVSSSVVAIATISHTIEVTYMPWPQESEGFIGTLTKPVVYYDGYVVNALMGIDCSMWCVFQGFQHWTK